MKTRTIGLTTFAAMFLVAIDAAEIPVATGIPKPNDAPKPMSPEESARAFQLPDGFRIEVVASEPLIASPSAVCWDERGRMFVSELHGYNLARSEERRVGKECSSPCRSRWSPY